MKLFLLRYGELALKGKNRKSFEDLLINNIRRSLKGLPVEIRKTYGRLFVHLEDDSCHIDLEKRLSRIFGLVSFSPVEKTSLDFEEIMFKSAEIINESITSPFTFKIETNRPNKKFPVKSPEISAKTGEYVLDKVTGSSVDVHNPDIKLFIEIRDDGAYIFHRFFPAGGGLPVGVSGKAILMLSGGIDSPVAGWMGMKRGLNVEGLHFQSPPFTSERSREKVLDIAKELATFCGSLTLHFAHFTEIQKEIHEKCPHDMGITIMRRMMFRLSEMLARKQNAGAIITGESLGQVASQTLDSIAVINKVTTMPVFRPLIGLDKEEITGYSRRIGTYEISIRPYEDCCTVFVPKHPVTRPKLFYTEKTESRINVQELLNRCMDNIETVSV